MLKFGHLLRFTFRRLQHSSTYRQMKLNNFETNQIVTSEWHNQIHLHKARFIHKARRKSKIESNSNAAECFYQSREKPSRPYSKSVCVWACVCVLFMQQKNERKKAMQYCTALFCYQPDCIVSFRQKRTRICSFLNMAFVFVVFALLLLLLSSSMKFPLNMQSAFECKWFGRQEQIDKPNLEMARYFRTWLRRNTYM